MATATRLAAALLVLIILARNLGAATFGVFAYWLALATTLSLVCDYGFNQSILRSLGTATRPREIINAALTAKFTMAVLVVASGIAISLWSVASPAEGVSAVILVLGAIVLSFSDFIRHILRGFEQFRKEAFASTIGSVASLASCLGILAQENQLFWVSLSLLIGRIFELCFLAYSARSCIPRQVWRFGGLKVARGALRRDIFFAFDSFLTNAFVQIDVILARWLLGEAAAGVYQVGTRLTHALAQAGVVLNAVFVPRIARSIDVPSKLRASYHVLITTMVVAGGVLGGAIAWKGGDLTGLLFAGTDLVEVRPLMPWFGALLGLRLATGAQGIVLVAAGFPKMRLLGYLGAYSTMFALVAWLTREWSIVGLVITMTACTTVLLISYSLFVAVRFRAIRVSALLALGVSLGWTVAMIVASSW